ncbi:transcription antitermination regulator [Nocardioides flavus (ex Wang et al. 2016)]|uniref:Transcription antitermination regulator n=1 Tax=Nocardioides flavus (ex Wang et al. 2016) TaxID=2058780 RepID=A0ABQ3HHC4_9ACTN|nr:GAF and ANTAR domain-containing protein [Nocardioides flavus (ex Wang et al. 2016)]GHE16686.1 transcription antitermination regulator [Nocardioides flavus (ex Wang et al. 2016)]
MINDDVFGQQLADAVRDLDAQSDPPHTLERLVEITPEFFESCDFVGVSLVERDAIRTPAASNERLRELDESQYAIGQGPCREAIRDESTVVVDDLATDPRWPEWGRAMVDALGIRSSLSFRLFTRPDRTWGALNVYSRTPSAFTEHDVVQGQAIAAMSAVALARSINDEQLAGAIETRTVIGQAMGIVMERYGLDEDRAFSVLRRLSSHQNVKLRDLAAQLVETRRLPGAAGEETAPSQVAEPNASL